MSYQGFTAEDGKYEVLVELTGQVCLRFFFFQKEQDGSKLDYTQFVILMYKIKNENVDGASVRSVVKCT